MALIKCPECNRDVSDQAEKCLYCGLPVGYYDNINENNDDSDNNLSKSASPKTSRNTKKIVVFVVLFLIISSTIGIAFWKKLEHDKMIAQQEKEYILELETAKTLMDASAYQLAIISYEVSDVWKDTIFENRNYSTEKYIFVGRNGGMVTDFNKTIANYYAHEDNQENIKSAKKVYEGLNQGMKDLNNPPGKYKEIYEDLQDLYGEYSTIFDLSMTPTGSYKDYTEKVNEVVQEYNKLSAKLANRFPNAD